jgi:hypothetical protein
MVETVNLFIQLFVFGALLVFLALTTVSLVLVIHLTSLPERRPSAALRPSPGDGSRGVR